MSLSRSNTSQTSATGISRRKTGCWTCRIRRKRCDEVQDSQGRCQECVRLNIPCAGWGEQRPEWAKDEETLRVFKETMKKQLMSRAPSRGQHQVEDLDSININMLDYYRPTPSVTSDSPEVFDFPGLSAQLFEIAQAAHLPSEYMVHIVQIAELGQWKQMQDDNGVLSYRELARRGQAIERSIFGQATLTTAPNYYPPSTPPHALTPQINYAHIPNASTSAQFIGGGAVPQPANFAAVVSQSSPLQLVYLDACIFMLHSVVSGPNPRVPELHGAAQQILSRLHAIPANQRPVSLIFPLCIAGILGDNAETQRVQAQISSLGASPDLAQAVNRLIAHIRQARWAHELNTSNPLMS